jgi:ribosome-interacting GTPase 1
MERFGLVGLPNAGKSSLYNALTGSNALAAPYPFATKAKNMWPDTLGSGFCAKCYGSRRN